jgi:hypothetical protein
VLFALLDLQGVLVTAGALSWMEAPLLDVTQPQEEAGRREGTGEAGAPKGTSRAAAALALFATALAAVFVVVYMSFKSRVAQSDAAIVALEQQVAVLQASLIAARGRSQSGHVTPAIPHWGTSQCTSDSIKGRTEQLRWDGFCQAMGFPFGGNPFQENCVKIKTQSPLTSDSNTCASLHGKHVHGDCLGPLQQLLGTWEGAFGKVYTAVPRWALSDGTNNGQSNDTRWHGYSDSDLHCGMGQVPGKPTAYTKTIKQQTYKEKIVFTPIYGAVRNRGYADADHINPRCEGDQTLTGVRYNVYITQTSATDSDGERGGVLHEEVGMWMYNAVPTVIDDWNISRMAVIPHGVAVVAQGNFTTFLGSLLKEQLIKEQEDALIPPGPLGDTTDDTTPVGSKSGCAPMMFGKVQVRLALRLRPAAVTLSALTPSTHRLG